MEVHGVCLKCRLWAATVDQRFSARLGVSSVACGLMLRHFAGQGRTFGPELLKKVVLAAVVISRQLDRLDLLCLKTVVFLEFFRC